MAQEHAILVDILRELVDKLQDSHISCVDRGACGERDETASLQEQSLQPSGPMHKNCYTEICICVRGHAYLQLKEQVVVLEPGEFLVIPVDTLYRECAPKGEKCKNLWLNMCKGNRIRANVTGCDESGKIGLYDTKMVITSPTVKNMLTEALDRELNSDQFGAAVVVKNRLVEVLIDMIRQMDMEEQGQFRHQWQETLVAETMDYLYRHGGERTELQAVAEHLCVSERQLNRIFKTATGTTVINYFNAQRILQARYYLIATNYRLNEIAEQLGYYDQYHFSRNFKKATGYTPSQFRKIRREG